MNYQLTTTSSIIRLSDGATIPFDEGNKDYSEYLEWVSQGNEALPPATPLASIEPNYETFLNQMVESALYQKILAQSTVNPIVNTAFTAAMGALILAASGRPNVIALQSGIVALLGSMELEPRDISSLQTLLEVTNLDNVISI